MFILRGLNKELMKYYKNSASNLVRLALLVFTVFGFCYSQAGLAQAKNILQIRTISVPPYGFETKTQASGIYYDIANILASEAGYQVNNYVYPYARIIHELKSGKTDLTIMYKYKELEDFVTYIAPLPTLKNVVIGKKGNELTSVEALQGKIIAYLRGAKFSQIIDDDNKIFKYRTIDFKQALMMLKNGRVDAVIGPMDTIISAAYKLNLGSEFLGKPLIVSERAPWLQVSKKSEHLISVDKLAAHFKAILKRGELKRLRDLHIYQ